jgi:hypothetical protein
MSKAIAYAFEGKKYVNCSQLLLLHRFGFDGHMQLIIWGQVVQRFFIP